VLFDVNYDRYGLFVGNGWTDYNSLFAALNSTQLTQFLTFTNLRFRLLYPATDGSEKLERAADLVRYYYAISDINLVAGYDLRSPSVEFTYKMKQYGPS